ncbi:MAG: DUF3187 family protein [Pelovirga sp.]
MRIFVMICVLLLISTVPVVAQELIRVKPLYTTNMSPVILVYGLPAAEAGDLTPTGELSLRFVAEVASHYTKENKGNESVLFDGETSRAIVSMRYGFAERWEAGVDVPMISHDGGVLDSFIEGWHDLFGLPQGGRDSARRNQLHYSYQQNNSSGLDYSGANGGFGDIALFASYQLLPAEPGARRSVALRSGIKLPTGNSSRLRSSGATDAHLRLAASDAATLGKWNTTLFASAGVLWLGKGDILEDQQRRWVGFGSIGIGWMPRSWIDVKLQLDGHTPFYDTSKLTQINSSSLQLAIGGSLHFSERVSLDLAVIEDVVVDSASDVVFHSALNWRF